MLEHWYSALRTGGICLRTSDREAFRQRLYAARRDSADPDLDTLSVVFSPTSTDEVWIIHSQPKKAPEL